MTPVQPPRPPLSSATLRYLWRKHLGHIRENGVRVDFGQGFVRWVAKPSGPAWLAFGLVLRSYNYKFEKLSTWVVRYIGGTTVWSMHAYGTASDVNYYLNGKNGFNRGWSWDKTDFTPAQAEALLGIRTNNGKQVFAWGGTWGSKQDYMHWYIACGPKDLGTGIDTSTIVYGDGDTPVPGEEEEMIQKGDKGAQVVKVQEALMTKGYQLPKWGADGDFGGETESAVRAFQVVEQLDITGSVGGVTAAFLFDGGTGSAGPAGPPGPKGDTPDLSGYKLTPA